MNMIRDIYGHEYTLYSGKIYICKNERGIGNIAAYIECEEKDKWRCNNGLHVIKYGEITDESIRNAIVAMGWKVEDWL